MRSSVAVISQALAAAVLLAARLQAVADPADLAAFYRGVSKIASPGVPGPLCVFGDQAFVVVVGQSSGSTVEPLVAAARYGRGRIVAFGHDGYFAPSAQPIAVGQTAAFYANAVAWAAGKPQPRVAVLSQTSVQGVLQSAGISTTMVAQPDLTQHDVLVVGTFGDDPVLIGRIRQFVADGGGLVIAAWVGWGWKQLNPGKDLAVDNPANKLLAPAGIVWADGYLSPTATDGMAVGAPPPDLTQAAAAITAITSPQARLSAADAAQATTILSRAAVAIPAADTSLMPRLQAFGAAAASVVPTPQNPVGPTDAASKVGISIYITNIKRDPSLAQKPHPAGANFPGSVPAGAPAASANVTVSGASAWVSTGLYAAPGASISVTIPSGVVAKGYGVRIGAHSDQNWSLDSWQRIPEISLVTPLNSAVTRAANPFGGLVYIETPATPLATPFSAAIEGAVGAPYFVTGKTDLGAWRSSVRGLPAPWAELEGKNVIVTLPASGVRQLDDPAATLAVWDQIIALEDELAGAPSPRLRKERIVPDQQISAGYMHSGYPVMTWMDVAPRFANGDSLKDNSIENNWGLFHEFGHNHQNPDWTFNGTGEVTVNLFTLYVQEKLQGVPPDRGWYVNRQARQAKMASYNFTRPNFSQWQQDPFLALSMYTELIIEFGWDPFQRVFREYLALPPSQRPQTDDDKRDQWMTRMSRAVGYNLGPFFDAWGVPTSAAAHSAITWLPPWIPAELPVPQPVARGPLPTIRASGVATASAYGAQPVIGPGAWIEIFGSDLATETRQWGGTDFVKGTAPVVLSGTSVTLNGQSVFISYVSPNQINGLTPSTLEPGPALLTVTTGNGTSKAYSLVSADAQPAVLAPPAFRINGRQYVAALRPDGSFPLPANAVPGVATAPAVPGETLVLYAIGFGATTPNYPAGVVATQTNTLVNGLQILFNGAPATIGYQGLAPGYVGLYQFNFVVPDMAGGDAVPLSIRTAGRALPQELWIAVRPSPGQ